MNKTKVTCSTKTVETFEIDYLELKGLSATVVVSTTIIPKKDPVVKVESSNFYYKDHPLYLIDEDVVSKFVSSRNLDGATNFYFDHVAPNIREYTVEEAKLVDLNKMYCIERNNIFHVLSGKNCTNSFMFSNVDMSSKLSNSIYHYAKSIGLRVEVARMFFDDVQKFIVHIDNHNLFKTTYVDIDGWMYFDISSAIDMLVTSYVESGDE